jgi:hypothetical protein
MRFGIKALNTEAIATMVLPKASAEYELVKTSLVLALCYQI